MEKLKERKKERKKEIKKERIVRKIVIGKKHSVRPVKSYEHFL